MKNRMILATAAALLAMTTANNSAAAQSKTNSKHQQIAHGEYLVKAIGSPSMIVLRKILVRLPSLPHSCMASYVRMVSSIGISTDEADST